MLPFDLPESLAINDARMKHLESIGLDLNDKTVLEPGSGIGLLTGFWEERNCQVTSVDLLPENIKENQLRHPWRKNLICLPIDSGFSSLGRFDIVFCYGLLYHVRDPERCLVDLASVCDGTLLLETMVHPVDDAEIHLYPQANGRDQGVAGPAYRPSRNWVMAVLGSLFPFAYVTRDQPGYKDFKTQWPSDGIDVSRSVFVASRQPISMPTLLTSLPSSQTQTPP